MRNNINTDHIPFCVQPNENAFERYDVDTLSNWMNLIESIPPKYRTENEQRVSDILFNLITHRIRERNRKRNVYDGHLAAIKQEIKELCDNPNYGE